MVRVEREVLPPRVRDLPPPAPRALHAPMAAAKAREVTELTWEFVNKTIAEDWLQRNVGNRRLKSTKVDFYTRQMKEGLWQPDHPDPIIFDRHQRLENGQHRLHAVVKSDATVTLLVYRNAAPGLRDVIDTQAVRTAGDMLALATDVGPGTGARYAAAIRGLIAWDRFPDRGPFERQPTGLSTPEIIQLYPAYKPTFDRYAYAATAITAARVPGGQSLWLVLLARWDRIDPAAAERFAAQLATGADLSVDHPILTLRNYLLRGLPAGSRPGSGVGRLATARYAVLAWNAWRDGRLVKQLQDPGGAFPKLEDQRREEAARQHAAASQGPRFGATPRTR